MQRWLRVLYELADCLKSCLAANMYIVTHYVLSPPVLLKAELTHPKKRHERPGRETLAIRSSHQRAGAADHPVAQCCCEVSAAACAACGVEVSRQTIVETCSSDLQASQLSAAPDRAHAQAVCWRLCQHQGYFQEGKIKTGEGGSARRLGPE